MVLHFGCLEYLLGSLSCCIFSVSSSPTYVGLDLVCRLEDVRQWRHPLRGYGHHSPVALAPPIPGSYTVAPCSHGKSSLHCPA